MKNCTAISTSRCSWFGRNTSRTSQAVTNTAGSANSIGTGPRNWIWCCGKSIALGEKLFVDYAGQTVPVTDPKTGVGHRGVHLCRCSGARATTPSPKPLGNRISPAGIGSHIRALEFLGACPALLIPDNLKTGVLRPCRYEPRPESHVPGNGRPTMGMAVIPARVRKPRDKAKAEAGVLLVGALDTGSSAQARLLQPR
jgi:transposase